MAEKRPISQTGRRYYKYYTCPFRRKFLTCATIRTVERSILKSLLMNSTSIFKIYGMESKLIEHVMRTFENTTSNLGMLFNGIKGTGKTITAKIIANRTNLSGDSHQRSLSRTCRIYR